MNVSRPNVSPTFFWLFLFSIFIPTHMSFEVAGLRLTPYRICLIIFFAGNLNYLQQVLTRREHRIEKMICGFTIWAILSLAVNHDFTMALETGGILLLETLGPVLVATAFCSSYDRIYRTIRVLGIAGSLLLLISLPEAITGINWFSILFDAPFGGVHSGMDRRMGFYRARASFDHPILYGVVMASLVGLTYFAGLKRYCILTGLSTITSLSSGAIVSLIIQGTLVVWHKVFSGFRKKWTLYSAAIVFLYIAAEIASNRSGMMALLGLITFSEHTAYMRINIWTAGLENVYANPIFGLGFNDWARPSWMHGGSMDNFWLVIAVRHGVPALALYAAAALLLAKSILSATVADKRLRNFQRGWLVGLAGSVVAGCTVHFWNASYVYFNFYLGLGLAISHLSSQTTSSRRVETS